jgi:hypothetical protein
MFGKGKITELVAVGDVKTLSLKIRKCVVHKNIRDPVLIKPDEICLIINSQIIILYKKLFGAMQHYLQLN